MCSYLESPDNYIKKSLSDKNYFSKFKLNFFSILEKSALNCIINCIHTLKSSVFFI